MIVLDEATHTYTLNGVVVPGVTSILNELQDFSRVPPHILIPAQELGTAVHMACELYDRGTLDLASLDPMIEPYLEGYRKFLHDKRPEWFLIEERTYHAAHGYAGMLDRGGTLDGELAILDLKTTRALDLGLAGPQTAAYMEAVNHSMTNGTPYKTRYALQLDDGGGYHLKRCADRADLAVFLSCLNLTRWRHKHGLKRN